MVMVDSITKFEEYIEVSELNLPSSTIAFEEDSRVSGMYYTVVHIQTGQVTYLYDDLYPLSV